MKNIPCHEQSYLLRPKCIYQSFYNDKNEHTLAVCIAYAMCNVQDLQPAVPFTKMFNDKFEAGYKDI